MEQRRTVTLDQVRDQFIFEWGKLCTKWGVNKTMGQIHALLLTSPDPLCADDIMETLSMSRGNVNMNLRSLEQWQLVSKVHLSGERKDYYKAQKDIATVFKIIVTERKKQELDPLLTLLQEVDGLAPRCSQSQEFCKVTKELHQFAEKADRALNLIASSNADWITKMLIR